MDNRCDEKDEVGHRATSLPRDDSTRLPRKPLFAGFFGASAWMRQVPGMAWIWAFCQSTGLRPQVAKPLALGHSRDGFHAASTRQGEIGSILGPLGNWVNGLALIKKCKCGKGLWSNCQHAWYSASRPAGAKQPVYVNLGNNEAEARRKYNSGDDAKPVNDTTFATVGARWLDLNEHRLAPNTYRNYVHALKRVNEVIGHIPVAQINSVTLLGLQSELAKVGLKPGTIKNMRIMASNVLQLAEAEGIIAHAPNMKRVPGLISDQPVKHLSPEDMKCLLSTVTAEYRTFFAFGWATGLRPGELLAVSHEDVNGNKLKVHRQVNTRTGVLTETTKTSRSRRTVDLGSLAIELLAEAEAATGNTDGRYWTFSYSSALNAWSDALKRCKLPSMGLHALRHSNASLRLSQGQDIVYVSDQLGHANSNTTLRTYAHLIPKPDRDLSAFDKAMRLDQ